MSMWIDKRSENIGTQRCHKKLKYHNHCHTFIIQNQKTIKRQVTVIL